MRAARWFVLVAFLLASPLHAQTRRTYGEIFFKNGGAYLFRDSLGLVLQIGSATDSARTWYGRIPPFVALGLSVSLKAALPHDTLAIGPYENATWRCTTSGCWVTITTPGLRSYFRPSPNIPPAQLPLVAAALVNALQAADVPAIVINLQ